MLLNTLLAQVQSRQVKEQNDLDFILEVSKVPVLLDEVVSFKAIWIRILV